MRFLLPLAVAVTLCFFTDTAAAQTAQLNATPVVLSGSAFKNTNLVHNYGNIYKATDVVGFIYVAGQTEHWVQVPVQVDERDTVHAGKIYNTPTQLDVWSQLLYGTDRNANYAYFRSAQYCDPNTFTGADHDPSFDFNDEIAFMLRDMGTAPAPADGSRPDGVDTTSGVESKIFNPVTRQYNYIYLFNRKAGSPLIPSAGKSYITDYTFRFSRNGITYGPAKYKSEYNISTGPNPERSFVKTPYYERDFADRWIDNKLIINSDDSEKQNLYDRHGFSASPGGCARSENTFSGEDVMNYPTVACNPDYVPQSEGAFVTNITGPVRVIRSYMGCNSGPLTQRTHIFYDQIEMIYSYLRVHEISGVMDFYDYNKAAGTMFYNNNNNNPATQPGWTDHNGLKGMIIDGTPDNDWKDGPLTWELINSKSGTIFRYNNFDTDLPPYTANATGPTFYPHSYYLDDVNAQADGICQCTGDASAWGTSGSYITPKPPGVTTGVTVFPFTDPRYIGGKVYTMNSVQVNVFLPVSSPQADTTLWIGQAKYLLAQPSLAVINWPRTYNTNAVDVPYINIYPNPTTGIITLEAIGSINQKIKVIFYNSAGKSVYSISGIGSINQIVDLHAQNSGLYIARIFAGNKVLAKKILVTK